jgi:hypothetical protein
MFLPRAASQHRYQAVSLQRVVERFAMILCAGSAGNEIPRSR